MTNANLAAAIRLSLFEKGLDPRDFALLSFGGAGSLHALHVAEDLNIRRVVFPVDASTLSAWGILHCDLGHDFARSRVLPADPSSLDAIAAMLEALRIQGDARLAADGIAPDSRILEVAADLRYRGQAFELTVPWRAATADATALAALVADFHAAHRARFSYANPEDAVELVTLRLAAIGALARPPARARAADGAAAAREISAPSRATKRKVWLDASWQEIAVLHRATLSDGQPRVGPVLVEEDYTTVLIIPGWSVTATSAGHLLAERDIV
jgi:N-methylhydantoinase A